MTPMTLAAHRASIEKWDRNTRAATPDDAKVDADDCPLCTLFLTQERTDCTGCPVSEKTGRNNCVGTPYKVALDAHEWWRWHYPYAPDHDACRDAFHKDAAAERDFLISLLPPGELP